MSDQGIKSEKAKNGGSKRPPSDYLFEAEQQGTPKKVFKKKNTGSNQYTTESKRVWLHEKAAESIIPTEEAAIVNPDRLFKGLDPLILHMCIPCKKFNSERETTVIEAGMVQIPLALCTVCRAHLVAQKNMKFYQHDCPSLKKSLNL